jgi:uncharacterized protein (TIGR03437 family)
MIPTPAEWDRIRRWLIAVRRAFGACVTTIRDASVQARRKFGLACLFTCWCVVAPAQNQPALPPPPGRPLILNQARYRMRPGETVRVDGLPETLDFISSAKTSTVTIDGTQTRGFAVGPNMTGDEILLAASLTTKAGEYAVTVSAVDESGERRTAAASITVDALPVVPSGASTPPVVLLNGWQFSVFPPSTCPISANGSVGTFGSLATQLVAPAVFFFDNCIEQSVNGSSIEELGVTLGQFLSMVQYAGGALVPQVDLVSHSMGGLIVRSYLAGLQANDALLPVLNPRVRKFIEIATPNFGSFLAGNYEYVLASGTQAAEMVPGSGFLWSLGTWNQHGDDLRGVDALAIIGNAGYWKSSIISLTQLNNATDGVVSMTSASLNFARDPSRTRILPYCHIDSASPPGAFIDCTGKAIANVDEAPETGVIVLSFLAGTTAWEHEGYSNQTQFGGSYFALENAAGTQYTSFSSVLLESQAFETGWTNTIFYDEFVTPETGTFTATSTANQTTTCGPFTATGGTFSIFRCKFSPVIFSVGPLLPNASGWVVGSGGGITISGVGFGQQCTGCRVLAYPGPIALQISSWSDAAIAASLPSTFNGIAEVVVQASAGSDSITFMVSPPPAPPTISLSSTQLQFTYTLGGASPAAQTVNVTNSGGGTLTWSASSNVPWLTVSSSASGVTVSVNPSSLSAGLHAGTITVSASGATNNPDTISVTLTVNAAPPSISLSTSHVSFSYTLGGSAPASQAVTVTNAGGGTFAWSASSSSSWLTVSPSSGTGSGTLTLGINSAGLIAQTYTGAVTVTASGAANSPQTISAALTVGAAAAPPVVSAVVNAASWTAGAVAPGELVVLGGTMLGPSTGVSGTVDPSTGKLVSQLAGTTVLFNGVAAPLLYTSATQVNAIVPYESAGCTQAAVQVQYQDTVSSTLMLPCASATPGVFSFNSIGTGPAAAANQDGTFNGPSSPAAKGSYVTLYFTGGGQTNPAGVTGSINGTSTLKWLRQVASVTVGGVAAAVAFDGAAPTFVDGVLQLNIQLSASTPSGAALPVVVTVGGASSPATATLAVQ